MTGDRAYRLMMAASRPQVCDGFDLHVFACIFAVALAQAEEERVTLAVTTGLSAETLAGFAAQLFPGALPELMKRAGVSALPCGPEEESVREILLMYASGPLDFARVLATLIARRCQEPRHLWQDLGLRDRSELSQLMQRHFPRLKARNSSDMKWKKFLYRLVCGAEGFVLCPAPICSECDDFASCFGAEEGVAQLTHVYREERA